MHQASCMQFAHPESQIAASPPFVFSAQTSIFHAASHSDSDYSLPIARCRYRTQSCTNEQLIGCVISAGLVLGTITIMSNFRASDNHVSHSSNTNFTHTTNVFGSAQTDDLQAWMRDQAAQSGALCVPGVFAPRLTESIAQSSGFRACVLQQSACMLLKGSMGAGKTTAICKLIQELRKEEHVIVVFILFDSSRALQQDSSRVLMHFVRQIVDLDDHDQRVLVSRLQQRSSCDRPSADEVVDTFIALTARRTQNSKEALCILLDGLDQFNNRDDLDTLLRHVANIQRRTRCGVIVTSRFEEICFHSIFKTHSDIPISATYEDAEHIVRSYSPSHHVGDLIVRDASLVNTISRAVMDGSRAL